VTGVHGWVVECWCCRKEGCAWCCPLVVMGVLRCWVRWRGAGPDFVLCGWDVEGSVRIDFGASGFMRARDG